MPYDEPTAEEYNDIPQILRCEKDPMMQKTLLKEHFERVKNKKSTIDPLKEEDREEEHTSPRPKWFSAKWGIHAVIGTAVYYRCKTIPTNRFVCAQITRNQSYFSVKI